MNKCGLQRDNGSSIHGTSNIAMICLIRIRIHILFPSSIGWKKVVEYTRGGCQFSNFFVSFFFWVSCIAECNTSLASLFCWGGGNFAVLALDLLSIDISFCHFLLLGVLQRVLCRALLINWWNDMRNEDLYMDCQYQCFPFSSFSFIACCYPSRRIWCIPWDQSSWNGGEWRWDSPHLSIVLTKWNR